MTLVSRIRTLDFGREACRPSTWPQKLMIEYIEIDCLFARGSRMNQARVRFVFNDNGQTPAFARMLRNDFERADGCDLGQILALLVAEMKLPLRRKLAKLCRSPRVQA
jgi:hypothetical protein